VWALFSCHSEESSGKGKRLINKHVDCQKEGKKNILIGEATNKNLKTGRFLLEKKSSSTGGRDRWRKRLVISVRRWKSGWGG